MHRAGEGGQRRDGVSPRVAHGRHAGAEPVGILLPPSLEPGLEKLIQIHALVRGVIPVLKLASGDGPGTQGDSVIRRAFPA